MSDEIFPPADLPALSPIGEAMVAAIRAREAADGRISVSRKTACEMLGIGPSREIELELEGQLHSYLDGSVRRVLVASIYASLIRLAVAAHPLEAPPKARLPEGRFKAVKRPARPRTEAELRGLEIGNAKRAEEARLRREAKVKAKAKAG
jgi:hypothetical protein